MRIATSQEMKEIERSAAESGLSYRQMMENAGRKAAEFWEELGPVRGQAVVVLAGKGNNGGDGFVFARCMHEEGAFVSVVLVDGEPKTEDSIANLDLARKQGIQVLSLGDPAAEEQAARADLLVDAVCGTGFHGTLRENARRAARLMNVCPGAVLALDIPSGVDADTGEWDQDAVRAAFTVSFDSWKPAHLIYPARSRCGELCCVDIEIPEACRESVPESFRLITGEQVFREIPRRGEDTNKGTFGRLLNVSSSFAMTGAGRLSTLGAMRVGTGLVTLAAPRSAIPIQAAALTEPTFLPLPETEEGGVSRKAIPVLEQRLERATAVLAGCGLGDAEDAELVVRHLLRQAKSPLVIDADGINVLGRNINELKEAAQPTVLTPHPAEMARLLGVATQEVLRHKVAYGTAFAKEYGAVLVLKGAHTLVFAPEGPVLVNPTGNSGMAKGGSGDILAGMIAGFLAQGIPAREAAMCGVYLHGLAGDRCAQRRSQTGMLPSELLEDLCAIFLEHER